MRLLSLSLASLLFAPAPVADSSESAPVEVAAPSGEAPTTPAESDDTELPKADGASASPSPVVTKTVPLSASPADAEVIDAVLPCGLRVRVAQDDSLPVAAVVLAIETGSVHDPEAHPGLVHALAFQLLMGGHELRPGQALADVRDFGGLATLAVGLGQVRFESLTPYAQLDRALAVEARRLRGPTTRHELWLKALSYARRDGRPRPPYPVEARAMLWNTPSLGHETREVHASLSSMPERAVGAQLAKLFPYARATLVVVAPAEPTETLAQIETHFAAFPKGERKLPPSAAPPTGSPHGAPRSYAAPKQKGNTYLWPVPSDPGAQAWAETLCATLNRIPAMPGEAKKTRVACTYAHDARYPALVIRGAGKSPLRSIQTRLEALESGQFSRQWKRAATARQQALETRERQALDLAIMLARAGESVQPGEGGLEPADFSGRKGLDPDDYTLRDRRMPQFMDVSRAILLSAPGSTPDPAAPKPATEASEAPTPAPADAPSKPDAPASKELPE
jgi:hypothetical protein